ncbi:hypothetical protein JCM11491_006689, partial [Sporobolomyces phaffii]
CVLPSPPVVKFRYNPAFAHPVYQPFLPPELVENPRARFLRPDDDVTDKTFDDDLLSEWERTTLADGERWSGREEIDRQLGRRA